MNQILRKQPVFLLAVVLSLELALLGNANLTGANLTEANQEHATFCKTTMPDGKVKNDNC